MGKGDRQARCVPRSPLPRPVASVKFSANEKRRGDRRERRGVRETQRDNRNDGDWKDGSTDILT